MTTQSSKIQVANFSKCSFRKRHKSDKAAKKSRREKNSNAQFNSIFSIDIPALFSSNGVVIWKSIIYVLPLVSLQTIQSIVSTFSPLQLWSKN
jgi:hypothetical protein